MQKEKKVSLKKIDPVSRITNAKIAVTDNLLLLITEVRPTFLN